MPIISLKSKLDYPKIMIYVVLINFFSKLIYVYLYKDQITVWEDHVISKNMLETGKMFYMQRGTANYMFQFPVYPLMLFFTYKIFCYDPLNAVILNLMILSVTCLLLYNIFLEFIEILKIKINKFQPELISSISVLIFLMHPFISYYSMFNVHPFIFDIFFPILIIFSSVKYLKLQNWSSLALLAISSGFGMLNRSTAFVALIPFFILGLQSLGIKKTIFSFLFVFSVTVLVISPWLMRGYSLYGKASMAPMLSEVLWKGSLYNSDGSNYLLNGKVYTTSLSKNEKNFLQEKTILVQNNFFKQKYSELLKNDPDHIFKMYLTKLKNFWLYHNNIGIEYGGKILSVLFIYKLYVIFILILNIGAFFLFGFKPLVLLSYPICLSLVQSIFYVETRHRMIAEPFLLFFPFLTIIIIIRKVINFFKIRD